MKRSLPVISLLLAAKTATLVAVAILCNRETQAQSYAFTNFVGLPGVSGTNDGAGTAARFYGPVHPAMDSAGNLFAADVFNHTIRKITPAGVVTTFAGKAGVSGTNNGTGSNARFNQPHGVGVDTNGNVFVADWGNHTIRKVTTNGVVTTLAGSPGNPDWADGTGSAARFNMPEDVAVDGTGNVYVAERENYTIRKITPAGVVTTLAGSPGNPGSSDGTGSAAQFNDPSGIAVDTTGNLFVGDRGNDAIRMVTPVGDVSTLAGSPGNPGWADGTGNAAQFDRPSGVAVDKFGNVFVTEEGNHTIRKVTAAGVVTTIGGLAGSSGTNNGVGSAARFNTPVGLAVDEAGVLYVADVLNYRICKGVPLPPDWVWAKRIASTVNPDDELSIGLALDSAANLYVTGWFDGTNDFGGVTLTNKSGGGQDIFVGKYNPAGDLQWVRRAGGNSTTRDGGRGIGVDNAGNVYVTGEFMGTADFGSFNLNASHKQFFLAKYDSVGTAQWVRQSVGGDAEDGTYGTGLAVDGAGNSYAVGFADNGATITFGAVNLLSPHSTGYSTFLVKYNNSGTVQWAQLMGGPGHTYTTKIALDTTGNVYVRGAFSQSMTIGTSNLVSSGSDMFLAKFSSSGALIWVRRTTGAEVDEGGVAVDQSENVYVTGWFDGTLNFGGISLTSTGPLDAFIAKYSNSGTPLWARRAGGTNISIYWDVALDQQGNPHVAGALSAGSGTPSGTGGVIGAKYDTNGTLQWANSASGPYASPVPSVAAKCVVDSVGNSYLAGWYQTNTTFGTNVLPPKGFWSFFLTRLGTNTLPVTDYTYITNNGAITITGYTGSGGAITIPSTINGLPVTTIGANAFGMVSTLTSVTIPNSVTNIGSFAFSRCTALTNINIPNSVTRIGTNSFSHCFNLPFVSVPASLSSIEQGAFQFCYSLTNVTLSSGLLSIGNAAFFECINLVGVEIPTSVTMLSYGAFQGCSKLMNIAIPSEVSFIGHSAFADCTNLLAISVSPGNSHYCSIDGVLFNFSRTVLIQYPAGKVGNYTIPGGVTNIDLEAFRGAGLTTLNVPRSLNYIGSYAFVSCAALTAVYVHGNSPILGSEVFDGAYNATVYYLQGTTGWDQWVSPPPAVLWNPSLQSSGSSFGVKSNHFGFNITGTTNIPIVVEASTNLTGSAWVTLQSGTLTNGLIYFSDPQWTNYSRRFYRIRSP